MSETKFTPGPWLVIDASFRSEPNNNIVDYGIVMREKAEISQANANLISSAPDLYAALKECEESIRACIGEIHTYHDWDEAMMRNALAIADAALKKAR